MSTQYQVITPPLGDDLHKDGKRLTPLRLKVLNLFETIGAGNHLSAEEVHEKLVKSSSKVSLATCSPVAIAAKALEVGTPR